MNDSVVLITGATSGIGQACAYTFAEHHYKLILVARRPERLDKIANDLHNKYQADVHCLALDIQDNHTIQSILKQIPEKFKPITVLINNAGVVNMIF